MSKALFVPLGVTKEYCPNWGPWECVREVVQNGLDAQVERDAPLLIDHKGTTLAVTNSGCLLPRQAMMLGLSTKSQNENLIGEHGEGLKVGSLAGFRHGYQISIFTGDEVWTPTVQFYEGYQSETFGFVVKPYKSKGTDQVRVSIVGVTAEDWFLWRTRFLNLPGGRRVAKVSCEAGDLLNDPAEAGNIYVKGVFVTKRLGMQWGYNFPRMRLNRDRQVIDSSDLYTAAARVFSGVGMQDLGWGKRMYALLASGASEATNADGSEAERLPSYELDQGFQKEIAQQFLAEHGPDAVAVASEDEVLTAESAGLKPVRVRRALRNIVANIHGSVSRQKERVGKEVRVVHAWEALDAKERTNFERAVSIFGSTLDDFAESPIEVVDFRLAETQVLCSVPADEVKYIRVARSALGSIPELVVAIAKAIGSQKPGLLEFLLIEALRRESQTPALAAAA